MDSKEMVTIRKEIWEGIRELTNFIRVAVALARERQLRNLIHRPIYDKAEMLRIYVESAEKEWAGKNYDDSYNQYKPVEGAPRWREKLEKELWWPYIGHRENLSIRIPPEEKNGFVMATGIGLDEWEKLYKAVEALRFADYSGASRGLMKAANDVCEQMADMCVKQRVRQDEWDEET